MAMLITKVREQAPELASTYQKVGGMLMKKGVKQTDKAAVLGFFDHSGSTEMGGNRLYSGHEMQGGVSVMRYVSDLTFCGGLFFDDDGLVPTYLFDTAVQELGDTSLANYQHVLDRHSQYRMGGTSYLCVLRKVLEIAGYNERQIRGHGQLSVKGTAPYPTYAAVVTDGEPTHDNERDIIELLTAMSQLPIFVQFIGVGEHRFSFLTKLDKLNGRLIDNCGFFDAKHVNSQEEFLEQMLSEFAASYLPGARRLGLLSA